MKHRVIILIAAAVCAVSCSQKPEIPFDDMVRIHHDMLMVDCTLQDFPALFINRDNEYVYLPILEKYGYSGDQYLAAVKYYIYDTEQFMEIMNAVGARLQGEWEALSAVPGTDTDIVAEPDELKEPSKIDTSDTKPVRRNRKKKKLQQPDSDMMLDPSKSVETTPFNGERKLTQKDLEEMERKLK